MPQGLVGGRFIDPGIAVVMNDGRIDAIGTHKRLIDAGGLYAKMLKPQAQRYAKDGA